MCKIYICFLFAFLCFMPCLADDDCKSTKVTLCTTLGDIEFTLYDDTPEHTRNFLQNVENGVYNGRTFNRVIADFVVQCGEEELNDVIPAEINYPKHHHFRGALAMGRCTDDAGHTLKSAKEQFYIVWGRSHDDKSLKRAAELMQERSYGRCKMDGNLRKYYKQKAGLPSLDGSYTVFGEVSSGLDVVEKIQAQPTDSTDRPLQDVTIIKAFVSQMPGKVKWAKLATAVDAYNIQDNVIPHISCSHDTIYTLHDWYGLPGNDVSVKLTCINDSTTLQVVDAENYSHGYYYVKTGIDSLPKATIYPGMFVETNTICSGFCGDEHCGQLWAYTYLYTPQRQWAGGHLYKFYWGKAPEAPLWTAKGRSTLVGNVPAIDCVIEAYENNRYIIRNWYGVDKYDLEFRIDSNGSIDVIDYYWVENGARYVQCRREDIGFASIPHSGTEVNGGISGNSQAGRFHMKMTAHRNDDTAINDVLHSEYVFEW
ncbi:MAG: peptidylprolyl isomerase [Muribaculaceae bacterium]